MIDFVRTIHEFWIGRVYCNLNFAVDGIVKFGNHQDVISCVFESVFNFDDLKFLWILVGHSFNFLENLEYLFLLWRILAPQKIWNIEANQIVWIGPILFPLWHFFVHFLRNLRQPVYKSIQIIYNEAFHIVYNLACKLTRNSLVFFEVETIVILQFIFEQMDLLLVINVLNFF